MTMYRYMEKHFRSGQRVTMVIINHRLLTAPTGMILHRLFVLFVKQMIYIICMHASYILTYVVTTILHRKALRPIC